VTKAEQLEAQNPEPSAAASEEPKTNEPEGEENSAADATAGAVLPGFCRMAPVPKSETGGPCGSARPVSLSLVPDGGRTEPKFSTLAASTLEEGRMVVTLSLVA
jgi:hypothetical protein